MYCLVHSLGPELVSRLLDKQVLDYRQRELAARELRVHVPIVNDKSPQETPG